MKPSVKFGLIVGIVALFVNAFIALFLGLCAPLISLAAGVAAGYLTMEETIPATAREGGKEGLISGLISGFLATVPLLCVAVFGAFLGGMSLLGAASAATEDELVGSLIVGLAGVGSVVIAVLSVLFGAAGGAATGYLRAQNMVKPTQTGL